MLEALVIAGIVAALALALLFTGTRHPVQTPSLVGPVQGGSSAPVPSTPAPSTTTSISTAPGSPPASSP